jgi:hypothetical protein
MPLSDDPRITSYEAADTDKSKSSLTVREKSYEPRVTVPAAEWEFASCKKDDNGKKRDPSQARRTSISVRDSSQITSMSSSIRPRIRWCLG